MHDLQWIRENPNLFDQSMERRGLKKISGEILHLDVICRDSTTRMQQLQKERNEKSRYIGTLKEKTPEILAQIKQEVSLINQQIEQIKSESERSEEALKDLLITLPNILRDTVPYGSSEEDNKLVYQYSKPREFDFPAKDHQELGESLGMLDFANAAKISGSRFVILYQDLALLERALVRFMLELHTKEHGFKEVSVPYLVNSDAMYGAGQLPKFDAESFKTTTGHWLIPTAEVPITNLVADSIVDINLLPLRYVAYTPCFRSEAGSAGKDTRGMIRMHQFHKVELVTITHRDNYLAELDYLTNAAEEVLRRLDLSYQKKILCSGDIGFHSEQTHDLEVWMPGQNKYREISSCSGFGQFQARRMQARYRAPQDQKTSFLYTINGSALAVGRTMIAILENYQNQDGSITIPEILRPYMNDQAVISKS